MGGRKSSTLSISTATATPAGVRRMHLNLGDDIFLLRLAELTLLYTGNRLSRFFPSTARLDIDPPSARDLRVLSAAKRNRDNIIENDGRVVTNTFKHTPRLQLTAVLEAKESEHPERFARVVASQFLHPEDYSIRSALYHLVAYVLCQGVQQPDPVCAIGHRLAGRRAAQPAAEGFHEARFPVHSTFEKSL